MAQNILIPVDFSASSMLAVEAGRVMAIQNDARVTVMFVHDSRGVLFGGGPGVDTAVRLDVDEKKRIHEELAILVAEKLEGVKEVKTALVLSESAAQGIVHYAEKEDVDMIVIATHGRSGLKRMLIGSVTERVVRHAPCPVLTLRSKL